MNAIIYLVVLPLGTAFLLGILYFFKKSYSRSLILVSVLLHSGLIFWISRQALFEPLLYSPGDWDRLGIFLLVDSFSVLMLSLTGLLVPLAVIYSWRWVDHNEAKYYILLFILTAGISGMVITADLFNLFVFFEITSIASYALVAIPKKDASIEGTLKYIIPGTIGGLFVLAGIILTYQGTGHLGLAGIAREFHLIPELIQKTIITFFVFGFGLKIALVPLHTWLPDSYTGAPLPYNVLSSGLVINAPLLALLRILYLFLNPELIQSGGITGLLLMLGALTIIVGHITAYQQDNIMRLLAYSSVAQMGYIIIGPALATEAGLIGGSLHMLNHALMKGALFFSAGLLIIKAKSRNINDFQGLGSSLPLVSAAFVISGLAIVGLPPFNGFVSKLLLLQATLESEQFLPALIILLGSFLSLIYYLKIFTILYSKKGSSEIKKYDPAGLWSLKAPALLLSSLCLILGLVPSLPLKIINKIPHHLMESINFIELFPGG